MMRGPCLPAAVSLCNNVNYYHHYYHFIILIVVSSLLLVTTSFSFSGSNLLHSIHPHSNHHHHYHHPTRRTSSILLSSSSSSSSTSKNDEYKKPEWMKCINGVSPKTGPLNEIVSNLANVTLGQANQLISIGAVWAKMDPPTEDDVLDQYQYNGSSRSSGSSFGSGTRSGSGSGSRSGSGSESSSAIMQFSDLEKGLKNFISKANIDFIISELERLKNEKANLSDFNALKSAHGK